MEKTNMDVILNLMAVRELDVAYRSCSVDELPTQQCCLRWTVEEEARQMVHIFDDLSTVRFNYYEKGVIRQIPTARATQAAINAYSFYYKYREWDQWSHEVREMFNQLLYLRIVKLAEIATGIRMDFNWMNTTLRSHAEYHNAISLERETKELMDRICRGEFEPTEEEVNIMSEVFPELEKALDDALVNMYGFVYNTVKMMWYDKPIALGSHFRG